MERGSGAKVHLEKEKDGKSLACLLSSLLSSPACDMGGGVGEWRRRLGETPFSAYEDPHECPLAGVWGGLVGVDRGGGGEDGKNCDVEFSEEP